MDAVRIKKDQFPQPLCLRPILSVMLGNVSQQVHGSSFATPGSMIVEIDVQAK